MYPILNSELFFFPLRISTTSGFANRKNEPNPKQLLAFPETDALTAKKHNKKFKEMEAIPVAAETSLLNPKP